MSPDGLTTARSLVTRLQENGFLSGSLLVFLGLLVNRGFGFVSHVVMVRFFGPVDFGGIALGLTLLTAGSVFGAAGLNQGLARYLPRLESENQKISVVTTGFVFSTVLSVGIGGMLIVFAPRIASILGSPSIVTIVRVFAVAIPLQVLLKISIGVVRGTKRTSPKVLISNILLPTSRLLLVVAVVLVGLGQTGIAAAYVVSFGITAAVGVHFAFRLVGFAPHIFPSAEGRSMLRFSAPLLVGGATSLVVTDLDILMLGALATPGGVGTYKAVYPLGLLLVLSITAVGYLLMPVLSELHAEDKAERMREVYRIAAKWTTALSLPVGYVLLVYPAWLIGLTFGSEYVSGSLALSVLAVGFLSHALTGPNGNALKSLGYPEITMYTSVILAVLNAGLNLLLIPLYGILGAAVATASSYVINNLLNSYILYSRSAISPVSRDLLVVIASGVGSASLIAAGQQVFGSAVVQPLLSIIVFVTTYGLLLLLFGRFDRDLRLVGDLV